MVNPYKPNTAAVPNILFDHWMGQLTDGEFKVLMAIARKTYGWNKARDMISLRQIEDMTGLSRKGITKIIDSLVQQRIVIKIKSKTEWGDDAPNMYEINVDYDEGVGNCKGGGSELTTPGVGNSVHQGGSVLSSPTKDTNNTKYNIQKEEEAAPPKTPTPSKKEKKKAEEKPKSKYRDNVTLTEEEHGKLVAQYGEEKLKWMLDFLDAKKGATGNKYKYTSDYHVLLPSNWVNEAYEKHRKEGKVIPLSVDQSKNDHASKNKQLCERVEDKLRNYFTPNIFFTAEPAAAFLKYGPKDYEKRYFYADHNYEKFKEEIQKDLKTFFPRAFPENGMTAQKIVERALNA